MASRPENDHTRMIDDPAVAVVDAAERMLLTDLGDDVRQAAEAMTAAPYQRELPPEPVFMSTDSQTRKLMPVATGVLKYFPDALMVVAWISRAGNDKHNPGQALHWAKEKSQDEPDCEARHMLDFFRNVPPDPGLEALGRLGHLGSKAWRALAHLQRECDKVRAEYENAHADPVG